MELIMAFRQNVGISCDSHIERLRAAFAHILAHKKKEAKKNRGEVRWVEKVLENSLISSPWLTMREDVGV
jgi:hypothetical protein